MNQYCIDDIKEAMRADSDFTNDYREILIKKFDEMIEEHEELKKDIKYMHDYLIDKQP